MSQDKRHHHKFLHDTIQHVDENPKELSPVLKDFKEMVDGDTRLYMLFNNMFEEVSMLVLDLVSVFLSALNLQLSVSGPRGCCGPGVADA